MSRRAVLAVAGLALGLALGAVLPLGEAAQGGDAAAAASDERWACPMLCVVLDGPGTCPVCGMDLERLEATPEHHVVLDARTAELVGLELAVVEAAPLTHELRAVGRVVWEEDRVHRVTAQAGLRVEALSVHEPWAELGAGQPLLEVFSADLVATAADLRTGGRLGRAAEARLRRAWGLGDAQIDALRTGDAAASERVPVVAPTAGRLASMTARVGQRVPAGAELAVVVDPGVVALDVDVPARDLRWVPVGAEVAVEADAEPGRSRTGVVARVGGDVDPRTRTVAVRVTLDNADGGLRQGMVAEARVRVALGADGQPRTRQGEGGEPARVLSVPRSAVLSTGARHLAYVQTQPRVFEPRDVVLGPQVAGDRVQVVSGLAAGEFVAAKGAFLMDSQRQLTGRTSLLAPAGSRAGTPEHAH